MIFDAFFEGLLRVIVISLLAYFGLIVAPRSAGKRALAKLNAFDLVVTVALGSTLAAVLLTKNVALLEGLLAFLMLVLLQWGVARFSIASPASARSCVANRDCSWKMAFTETRRCRMSGSHVTRSMPRSGPLGLTGSRTWPP